MWEEELRGDEDCEFLLNGVTNGFRLINHFDFVPAECHNYSSALDPSVRDQVEAQIQTELVEGRYERVYVKPTIISALGAIKKPNGGIRLIHDASRPPGLALNDYAEIERSQKFQSINDAVDCLSHGAFLCKIDLKSAYRSVPVHPSDFVVTGLKWRFNGDMADTWLIDKRLPFGARFSPGIFHRLTQSVRRMMSRRGFHNVIVFLDDFLIVEPTLERCVLAQRVLITLLRSLGFDIAWDKVEGPAQKLIFLGIEIDTIQDLLVLPEKKLQDFEQLVESMLSLKRVSYKRLQALAGKLNWASAVVRGGRTYLRRILDLMKPIKQTRHKIKVTQGMKEDLLWWSKFLWLFNGKSTIQYHCEQHVVYADGCDVDGACFYNGDWKYVSWS